VLRVLWGQECQKLLSRLLLRAVELPELQALALLLWEQELALALALLPAWRLAFSLKALLHVSLHQGRWFQLPLVRGLYAREELELPASEEQQVLEQAQQALPEGQALALQPQQVQEREQELVLLA
jgi:hypothetical protein